VLNSVKESQHSVCDLFAGRRCCLRSRYEENGASGSNGFIQSSAQPAQPGNSALSSSRSLRSIESFLSFVLAHDTEP